MRLEGKVALVTGASSGMGAATAALLAERGARVFTAQRSPAGFEDILVDLSDQGAPLEIANAVRDGCGTLDMLINNAGMMREGTVEETSLDDWAAQIHLNLTIPFLLTREVLPMLRASRGAIVNLGSIEGIACNPRHPAYSASKAGLHGLTRAIAVDHGPEGVRCNAVAPGWISTKLNERFIDSIADPVRFREEIDNIHPLRRTGRAEDVARLVVWLASDEADFVTGQVWAVDGGRMTRLPLP